MCFHRHLALAYTWKNFVGASPPPSHRTRDSYLAMLRWSEDSPRHFNFNDHVRDSSCVLSYRRLRATSSWYTTSFATSN
jgi:hypothetical protein